MGTWACSNRTGISWLAISVGVCAAAWPNGPFYASGRWVADTSGAKVTQVGVNWPGHGEVMIPEGLQHQSIPAIVSKTKSLGMNAIRLTYATEMIDQIYDNGREDITIETALINALGRENGTQVLDSIIKNNPAFSPTTTRLEVWTENKRAPGIVLTATTRSLTRSQQSARGMKSTFFSTTTCPRRAGAAAPLTATRGGETPTSQPPTGRAGWHIWPST